MTRKVEGFTIVVLHKRMFEGWKSSNGSERTRVMETVKNWQDNRGCRVVGSEDEDLSVLSSGDRVMVAGPRMDTICLEKLRSDLHRKGVRIVGGCSLLWGDF